LGLGIDGIFLDVTVNYYCSMEFEERMAILILVPY